MFDLASVYPVARPLTRVEFRPGAFTTEASAASHLSGYPGVSRVVVTATVAGDQRGPSIHAWVEVDHAFVFGAHAEMDPNMVAYTCPTGADRINLPGGWVARLAPDLHGVTVEVRNNNVGAPAPTTAEVQAATGLYLRRGTDDVDVVDNVRVVSFRGAL